MKVLTRIATSLKLEPPAFKPVVDVKKNCNKPTNTEKNSKKRISPARHLRGRAGRGTRTIEWSKFYRVLKSLQSQEKQRLSSARIHCAQGKKWNGGIIAMVSPDNQGE